MSNVEATCNVRCPRRRHFRAEVTLESFGVTWESFGDHVGVTLGSCQGHDDVTLDPFGMGTSFEILYRFWTTDIPAPR